MYNNISNIFSKPKYEVVVVVPIYKSTMNKYERISFDRCLTVLGNYDIRIVAPERIQLDLSDWGNTNIQVSYFYEAYFKNISGYNKLMLSPIFYSKFIDYKYILICQLDTFIFRNELSYWCKKSYDYIGAPWLYQENKYDIRKFKFGAIRKLLGMRCHMVGNGGLSLRKVRKFLLLLKMFSNEAKKWENNEDYFWATRVPSLFPFMNIPDIKTSLEFSFETYPRDCFKINNSKLPFGCHAWEKYDIDFWRPHIEAFGYKIGT